MRRWAGHLGVSAPDRPLFPHLAGSSDPLRQIALLAELGLAGVCDNYLSLRPAAEQATIGEALARSGLEMGSFVHDPAHWNLPVWSGARDAVAAALAASLDAAARSGSRTINVITGRDLALAAEEQRRRMADNLAWAGDRAGKAGVALCIEATHPAVAPGLLLERVGDALALLDQIDHPFVRLNLDTGHIAMHGDDVVATIRAAGRRIGMVQTADMPSRIAPGAGTLDWPAIFAALDAVGYDGLLELEFELADTGEAGERALLGRLAGLG
jgi:sugar phosphate isomerase/epimerase